VLILGSLYGGGVDLSLPANCDVVSGHCSENQTNDEPDVFFVHAATFSENWKKYKTGLLRARFHSGKNAGEFTTGGGGGFRPGFTADRRQVSLNCSWRTLQPLRHRLDVQAA
jgi:hypothetical protein